MDALKAEIAVKRKALELPASEGARPTKYMRRGELERLKEEQEKKEREEKEAKIKEKREREEQEREERRRQKAAAGVSVWPVFVLSTLPAHSCLWRTGECYAHINKLSA